MPARDGTGPMGQGSSTGRGFGPCGGGQSRGRGCGRGFGWRSSEPVQLSKEEQKKVLEAEKKAIEKRLKEMEGTKE